MSSRVALVTGSNKGIGYEIVKKLCREFVGIVYLTARNEALGMEAVAKLQEDGIKKLPKFHQLDVTDQASIERLRDHIASVYNGLDVLINNAGVSYKLRPPASHHEQATETIKVNFTGALNVSRAFFPLLKPHARVVHVTSIYGQVSRIPSQSIRDEFVGGKLSEATLVKLVQEYVDSTPDGSYDSTTWQIAYSMSKLALNCLTEIQARVHKYDKATDILINSCCPGYCRTDLGGLHEAPNSAAQGADTPVYLALLPPGQEQPHGKFYFEKKEIFWK